MTLSAVALLSPVSSNALQVQHVYCVFKSSVLYTSDTTDLVFINLSCAGFLMTLLMTHVLLALQARNPDTLNVCWALGA